MQNRNIIRIAVIVGLILLIPLTAMQFTEEVNWDLLDFALVGVFLFSIGLVGAFLLFWVNGAVGIIGNEGQSVNLMYGVVFVVGLSGSLIARFKPRGMARTLFAAALTQMLVPVIVLIVWPPPIISWAPGVFGVFVLSAFFAMLFVVSALLFRRSALK